ncbi:MAG: hypothetical protein QOF29_1098 [bacterium]|jgi:hypothetical protein|nr:hypothetical protein [Solirubrobacteraceae bacterium]
MTSSQLSSAHAGRVGHAAWDITIRPARPSDEWRLVRLAALDSARPLRGERVVAESDGRLIAAVSVTDGRAVADPFQASAGIVDLLRVRIAQGAGAPPRRRRQWPKLPSLAPRRPAIV